MLRNVCGWIDQPSNSKPQAISTLPVRTAELDSKYSIPWQALTSRVPQGTTSHAKQQAEGTAPTSCVKPLGQLLRAVQATAGLTGWAPSQSCPLPPRPCVYLNQTSIQPHTILGGQNCCSASFPGKETEAHPRPPNKSTDNPDSSPALSPLTTLPN